MVCLEDFFTPSSAKMAGSAIKLAMLGTVIRLALYDAGMPFFIVSPSTLKKYILGKGIGQKDLIVREVYRKLGLLVADNDTADAAVLAFIAESLVEKKSDLTKPQQEVISRLLSDGKRYNA
jgi:Holliday junction resolvasome RuvABC endonuclease subunit